MFKTLQTVEGLKEAIKTPGVTIYGQIPVDDCQYLAVRVSKKHLLRMLDKFIHYNPDETTIQYSEERKEILIN